MPRKPPPPLTSRLDEMLFGPRLGRQAPERVLAAIRKQEDDSEVLVCIMQICAIVFFAGLYELAPKAFGAEVPFEPVPVTLAVYGAFTLLRLALAWQRRLTPAFLALSVVVDVVVLMVTIWSFHLQYDQPAAVYLKAPTLLYVFIIIALRALRFDPLWVVLAGLAAALGWLALLGYALWGHSMAAMLTRDFAVYATSSKLLIGAEIDKIVSILVVTAILALALVRARRMLIRSIAETTAANELSRFFAPDIAASIVDASERLEPGTGVVRQAAILFIDLRGFTALSSTLEPTEIVQRLGEYHELVLPIVRRHGGSVITYLGDGIMITFGATRQSATAAADAVRAASDMISALATWAETQAGRGQPLMRAGIGVAYGRVVCGTIGTEGRLEYATIGDPVNRAARLQGLTKSEGVPALVAADAWTAAIEQGLEPTRPHEPRRGAIAGIAEPVDMMAVL